MNLRPSTGQKKSSVFDSPAFFNSFLNTRSWEPPWLNDFRRKHWEEFLQAEKSFSKEGWRFSPRARFGFSKFQQLLDNSNSVQIEKSDHSGITFETVEKMILDHPDVLASHIDSHGPDLGAGDAFHLISSLAHTGFYLHLEKNADPCLNPMKVSHSTANDSSALFHRNIIILEPFAEVTLIESIGSEGLNSSSLFGNVTHIELGEGSKLNRILFQSCDPLTTLYQLEHFNISRNASVTNTTIHLGSAQSRVETKGSLLGEGAVFENYSLFLGKNKQLFDQRTMQHHLAPHGRSNLVCKNALSGESKSIFSGMIKVDNSASSTDAYQSNRNLLLSGKAEADSLPGLEILANEVKCSHGATTSRIDEGELFYLLARGIPQPAAEKLIALGFFEEIVDKVGNENEIERIRKKIESQFEKNE